jgi:hypothetical protein
MRGYTWLPCTRMSVSTRILDRSRGSWGDGIDHSAHWFNLLLMECMTGRAIGFVPRSTLPMICLMLPGVALLVASPELATWLPRAMAPGGRETDPRLQRANHIQS